MSDYGVKISEAGNEVLTAANKNLHLGSHLDTFKIKQSGTLTVELPARTFSEGESVTYTASYNHALDYIPFILPSGNSVASDPTDTTTVIVNDESQELPPTGAYSPALYNREATKVFVTTANLTVEVTRRYERPYGFEPATANYVAKNITVYYTVFHNQMNAEFNLLA